jgi:hypothetical protein
MPTYVQIADRVRVLGGGHVKTCWIAHVKADYGLTRGMAPNRHDPRGRVTPCPATKRPFIERALRDLAAI